MDNLHSASNDCHMMTDSQTMYNDYIINRNQWSGTCLYFVIINSNCIVNLTSDVVPIFKKNDMLNKMNYRPISILSCISKIFEKLLISQLRIYFDDCCIVDRDNNKSMQLDSIMFNSISKQYKK